MSSSLFFWAVCACFVSNTMSYKILVVAPMPSRSHNMLGKGIADILHNVNHEITFITGYPDDKAKYRQIPIDISAMNEMMPELDFDKMSKTSVLEAMLEMPSRIRLISEILYNTSAYQKFFQDRNEKFDLVVVEYFMNNGMSGLGVRFDCPVILISPFSPMHWLARFTGNPVDPSIVPNAFLSYNQHMTFSQRILNTLMAVVQELVEWLYIDNLQEEIYHKYYPEEAKQLPFTELHKKIALVFSNSHPSLGSTRPLLPNVVEVGGFHFAEAKPLPEEYKQILDGAKNGAIYFSMGSILNSSAMPQELKKDILTALSKRKEIVLWKYEEDLPERPKNVIIRSWMPQASILTHPNVKFFISHGGLLSTTEAMSAGVPVLSIPIFGDQFLNAKATQDRGCGILLQYTNLSESSLTWALNEIGDNPKYSETAKKVHQLFHDRPIPAKDLVKFYAEHVIKTGGAPHLSAPHLPLYSSLLIDVILVLLLPPLLLLTLVAWIIRKIYKSKCRNKSHNQQQKKKKNQ